MSKMVRGCLTRLTRFCCQAHAHNLTTSLYLLRQARMRMDLLWTCRNTEHEQPLDVELVARYVHMHESRIKRDITGLDGHRVIGEFAWELET